MRKQIPAKTEITCDGCGNDCIDNNYKQSGRLTIKQDALDWYGSSVADGTKVYDLCDYCLGRINGALDIEFRHIKADCNEKNRIPSVSS